MNFSEPAESGTSPDDVFSLLLPALSALVMRQARIAVIEGRMIAGVDKKYGSPIGLAVEDRRAMALVSRACLSLNLPDYGSEIHNLLAMCVKPLGEWLPVTVVSDAGLSLTRLISDEYGAPTPEAEELAKGFFSLTAGIEEQLFAKFREALEKHPKASATDYYTAIREFVIRHPLADGGEIKTFGGELPSTLWMFLQQHFYEPVPFGWTTAGEVSVCGHCGNAMRQTLTGPSCRTVTCAVLNAALVKGTRPVAELLRVSRGIQQYWVEPGIDEIRFYDALVSHYIVAELYPHLDRVDIAVDNIGIDLKSYSSPELLGRKIGRDKGGLAFYEKKWLVVPDWLIACAPHYLDRLRSALDDAAKGVRCLAVSAALRELTGA
ncbi:MAG: restriction endonuclease-related protein [Acidiferrobacter sp.]